MTKPCILICLNENKIIKGKNHSTLIPYFTSVSSMRASKTNQVGSCRLSLQLSKTQYSLHMLAFISTKTKGQQEDKCGAKCSVHSGETKQMWFLLSWRLWSHGWNWHQLSNWISEYIITIHWRKGTRFEERAWNNSLLVTFFAIYLFIRYLLFIYKIFSKSNWREK